MIQGTLLLLFLLAAAALALDWASEKPPPRPLDMDALPAVMPTDRPVALGNAVCMLADVFRIGHAESGDDCYVPLVGPSEYRALQAEQGVGDGVARLDEPGVRVVVAGSCSQVEEMLGVVIVPRTEKPTPCSVVGELDPVAEEPTGVRRKLQAQFPELSSGFLLEEHAEMPAPLYVVFFGLLLVIGVLVLRWMIRMVRRGPGG